MKAETIIYPLVLALIILFTSGCKKDKKEDEPVIPVSENSDYFEFVVSSNYIRHDTTLNQRKWLFIYSSKNEMLIEQELQNGISYSYDNLNLSDEKVKVQIITKDDYSDNSSISDAYRFKTYTDISPAIWKLGIETGEVIEPIGKISLDLSGVGMQNSHVYNIRTSYPRSRYTSNNDVYEVDQYFNPDDLWLLVLYEGRHHYRWYTGLGINESITIGYNELISMTDYVSLDLPQNDRAFFYVEAEDDLSTEYVEQYNVYLSGNHDGETWHDVYYPGDVFSGYYSYYSLTSGNMRDAMITSRGVVPNKLERLHVDITINDDNVNSFSSIISSTQDICDIKWETTNKEEIFEYRISGSASGTFNYNAPQIPESIKALNPQLLNLNSLVHDNSSFAEYSNLENYDAYIKAYFVNQEDIFSEEMMVQFKYFNSSKSITSPNESDMEFVKKIKSNPFSF